MRFFRRRPDESVPADETQQADAAPSFEPGLEPETGEPGWEPDPADFEEPPSIAEEADSELAPAG